jgi:hypothetical protein
MPATFEPIASTVLTATTASVIFSSIPQTFTDLVLVITGTSTLNGDAPQLRFNNDTGLNYSHTDINGSGTTTVTQRQSGRGYIYSMGNNTAMSSTTSNVSNVIIQVMNYSNTTTHKTVLSRANAANGTYAGTAAIAGLWRSTAAINRIDLTAYTSYFWNIDCTFSLYGIRAGA